MTTYSGGDLVDRAQTVLDRHAVSCADGLCLACRVPGRCIEHDAAARVFVRSARLRQRRPGSTRPGLIGAKRIGERGLLARAC
jgi:hypothetical protein